MKDFFYRSRWSLADRLIAWGSVLVFGGYLLLPTIGKIEGAFIPVTSRVKLIESQPAPPPVYRTLWTAQAEKYRERCDYSGIEFTLVQDSREAFVLADFTDPPEVRSNGLLEWSGLRIWLHPDQMDQAKGYVYHQCPWRPWLTRTRFH